MPDIIAPVIPETITVHLGAPDSAAQNVAVPFVDYIKNVASSEIYPTWPENALRANIYAIISYALNRIYTEWYRSRGYDFDITNTTRYDQAFVPDRDIFENINDIVDEIFDEYVVREGSIQPLFTQFCNGTTSTCAGLSQWGTVPLAEQGLSPLEILKSFYGDDIRILTDTPVDSVGESYPGDPLRRKGQTVQHHIADRAPGGFHILPVGRKDLLLILLQRVCHAQQRFIFLGALQPGRRRSGLGPR